MRRKDRSLTREETIAVLSDGRIAQVAFVDNGQAYIVSMNYGFAPDSGPIRLYFHSAVSGRKIDCLRQNPEVCFTVALPDAEVYGEGSQACTYGLKYRSVVGYGRLRIVTDETERISGLNLLMRQCTGTSEWTYDAKTLRNTTVSCIEVRSISGKSLK